MGTHSIIAVQRNGYFESIYCHWDGYPSNNGRILLAHYSDPAKVDALITLGSLSSLEAEVGPVPGVVHTFEAPQPTVTVAYGRDRGETDVAPCKDADLYARPEEFLYLFVDGAWLWAKGDGDLQPLTAEDCAE